MVELSILLKKKRMNHGMSINLNDNEWIVQLKIMHIFSLAPHKGGQTGN